MRKIILLFLVFCAISCVERPKLEKPFIIVDENFRYVGDNEKKYFYQYQDKNGYTREFCSDRDNWNVGDTIK